MLRTIALIATLLTPVVADAGFRAGFNGTALPANDDGSSPQTALGFTANYYGSNYMSAFVNNNGNLTFDTSLSEFTPFGLTTNLGTPIIAAFFADVDTRGAGSGLTRYGTGIVDGRVAFGATWDGVGYFIGRADKLNSFQLLLINRGDTGDGNFDIEFNYNSIQWESGSASGGTNGLGGNSARAGFSAGTGVPGTFAELAGSGVNGAFLDSGPNSLAAGSLNSGVAGRYVFTVRNGAVITPTLTTPAPAGLLAGLLGAGLLALRRRLT